MLHFVTEIDVRELNWMLSNNLATCIAEFWELSSPKLITITLVGCYMHYSRMAITMMIIMLAIS